MEGTTGAAALVLNDGPWGVGVGDGRGRKKVREVCGMGGVVLDAGQGRGAGGALRGGGQWAGKWTVGNRTMQKFLGGLSHTSNYASSLQTAIGLGEEIS